MEPPKDVSQIKMGRNFSLLRRLAYRVFDERYFPRRIKTKDGICETYVTAGAQLSILNPLGVPIDPVHTRFIDRWVKPDSVVWDVGGNIGLFAFPAALKARQGQVYTFEPDVDMAAMLLRGSRRKMNSGLPVTVVPFALSDTDGTASFEIAMFGRSMNKLKGVGTWRKISNHRA